jgi:hypothetical protein
LKSEHLSFPNLNQTSKVNCSTKLSERHVHRVNQFHACPKAQLDQVIGFVWGKMHLHFFSGLDARDLKRMPGDRDFPVAIGDAFQANAKHIFG